VVHAETPPDKLADAALATWRELSAARRDEFRAEELVRAQRVLEARWLRRLETMDGQAAYLASWEAEGGVSLGAAYYDRLISASVAHVQHAMHEHLDPSQVSVMVYRPPHASALPSDAESMRRWLGAAESQESVTALATPSVSHAHIARVGQQPQPSARAERVVRNVHVFRTAREVPVLIHARPGTPLVSIGVFMRAGSVSEPEGREGLARLMAQSTLKGTHTRSGAEIALAAESLGGSIGVSAGLESLGWSMSVPVRQLDAALELLADVVQFPTFSPAAVDTERQLAMAEVERLRDDMYRWPMRLASEAAYRGHPYARSVIGSAVSLEAISADDVRLQHETALHAGACVIGIVGDVNTHNAATAVQRHFSAIAWGADRPPAAHTWPNAMRIAEDTREKQQTALAMLFRGPSRRDPARHTARVLAAIASGLGGRFFEELRDRRSLAYTVAAYPIERRVDGVFAAYIATTPAREEEAREGLLEQFAALCREPVRDDEIERARQYLVGTHAIAQQSGATVLSDLIDAWSFGDGLEELAEHDARVLAVTPEHILELARTYFDPARRVEGVVRGRG
jgi:zinc protease